MGYSKHIRAFNRVKHILDALLTTNAHFEVNSPPGMDASKFAYYIREGIFCAEYHYKQGKENFKPYAELKLKYTFKAQNQVVKCTPRLDLLTPIETLARMNISGVSSTIAVLGAAIMHKAPEMHFPQASIETINPETLAKWAEQNGYFLVVEGNNSITLTKQDPGDLAWKPQTPQ